MIDGRLATALQCCRILRLQNRQAELRTARYATHRRRGLYWLHDLSCPCRRVPTLSLELWITSSKDLRSMVVGVQSNTPCTRGMEKVGGSSRLMDYCRMFTWLPTSENGIRASTLWQWNAMNCKTLKRASNPAAKSKSPQKGILACRSRFASQIRTHSRIERGNTETRTPSQKM